MEQKYPEWIKTDSERRMYDHFPAFLWFMFVKVLGLGAVTWIQYDIARYLQAGPRRRIIEAFRGVGKSWITAIYVLWLLYRDPQHKIMVVSASKDRSDAFSIFVKRLISITPLLKFLEPRDDQRNSNIAFDVGPAEPDQSPSVKSIGITGQLTGSRADTIVADDIEIPKNSATELQREKLGELVKEFDAVLKPGGQVVYLGTPQVAQSLYSFDNLQSRGYECRVWPARYTDDEKYAGNLSPMLIEAMQKDPSVLTSGPEGRGTSTEPTRFDDLDLMEREASYGKSGFALQFMLDTSLDDANRYPLKMSDLIVMDVDSKIAPVQLTYASGPQQVIESLPNVGLNGDRCHAPMYVSKDFVKYQGSVMHIDPSGRGKDQTAFCVTKMLNGWIYVTRWGGLPGGYDDSTLTALALIAKEEQVNLVRIEENFGDGMYTSLFLPVLTRHYRVTTEDFRVSGQKELRIIDKVEPVLNQHRLVMDKSIVEADSTVDRIQNSGLYQMTHITRDKGSLKHDDLIDCLAESVGYWTEMIDNDVNESEKRHKEKLKDEELKKFMDTIKGKKRKHKVYRTQVGPF